MEGDEDLEEQNADDNKTANNANDLGLRTEIRSRCDLRILCIHWPVKNSTLDDFQKAFTFISPNYVHVKYRDLNLLKSYNNLELIKSSLCSRYWDAHSFPSRGSSLKSPVLLNPQNGDDKERNGERGYLILSN